MSATPLTLLTWLSPVFPTGGFAYSSGLEQAIAAGLVRDRETLLAWLEGLISFGSAWNDAVITAEAIRCSADDPALDTLAQLAIALATSAERRAELIDQGRSFTDGVADWCSGLDRDWPLPVALGAAAGRRGFSAEAVLPVFLHAFATNQCQAAIRLSVIGQTGAASLLAQLEGTISHAANAAADAGLDGLGGSAVLADLAAMAHETLQPRLFRS